MAGDPEDWHPSKDRRDSFSFTNATAGHPTEEQLGDVQLWTIKLCIFLYYCSKFLYFSLYTFKYDYRWKNEPVKFQHWKIDTDLQICMQTHHSSGAITGMEGTCWSPTIWSQMSLLQHIIKKIVTDPWPATYQNSNDYWCCTMTRKDLAGSSFKHQ